MLLKEIREIDIHLRARYPLLYIVSNEEMRIIDGLIKAYPKNEALRKKPNLYVWSCATGIRSYDKLDEIAGSTRDPMSLLRFINNVNESAIFVLNDFHVFLKDEYYDYIRYLKELSFKFKKMTKNIIIISPILVIPKELEKEIAIIDVELPNKEVIRQIYDQIANDFKGNPNVKLNGNKESVVRALQGLTINEIENVLYKSVVKDRCFDIDNIISEKAQIIRKTGILEYYHSQDSLQSIGGLDLLKAWIQKRKNAFTLEARKQGLPYPKGILLLGIAGCGKSLCCKVISNLWKFPLLRLDIGAVMGGIVGESERNIRKAIQLAEAVAPSILWIDEIEKGFSGIESSGRSDGGTTSRVIGTFLTWLQENTKSVFVVATANDISKLPPELMRKGRFDEVFFVNLPNSKEREEIFSIHLKKYNKPIENFNLEKLSERTRGFSGAEIEAIVVASLYDCFDLNQKLNQDILNDNIDCTVPLSESKKKKINNLREWAVINARPTTTKLQISTKRSVEL